MGRAAHHGPGREQGQHCPARQSLEPQGAAAQPPGGPGPTATAAQPSSTLASTRLSAANGIKAG